MHKYYEKSMSFIHKLPEISSHPDGEVFEIV